MADTFSLSDETLDDLLYLARAGETDDLREALGTATSQHAGSTTERVLTAAVNEQGNGLLHYSCANGHLTTVEYLLPLHSLELLLRPNQSGNTPLHWAALNGNSDVVKALTARIEEASSATGAGSLVKKLKADQRAREAERKRNKQQATESATKADDGEATAEQVRREDDEEDHRPLWDCRNAAGRGPMSEAQLAEKETVVQFLLEHSLAGAPPAPTDEEVADQDSGSVRPVEQASKAEAQSANGAEADTLADSVDKVQLQ
ncbi:hypothetical protein CF319_g2952 [Tilletia indica]|nr:hypothetical protein CF319_g2952 [Tilletia indica]